MVCAAPCVARVAARAALLTRALVIIAKEDGYTNVSKQSEIILIVVGAITTLTALTSFFGYAPSLTH